MSNIKERLTAVMWYFYDRLTEPSGIRGLIQMIMGGGWKALDGTSKGEALAQWGLIILGALQFFLPQRVLYRTDKPEHK